ncbi:MAG TPA: portal protein [Rhizobium sp.]|nr:portal protein [Rhizobium sp.]
MKYPEAEYRKINATLNQLNFDYEQWRPFHRELAQFLLPARYSWLSDQVVTPSSGVVVQSQPKKTDTNRNKQILDPTGTKAARDLAAGMLNGTTSPSRPWFNLRIAGFNEGAILPPPLGIWLEETRRRMLLVLAESNFYNAMAMMFLDLVVFGTAGMIIYEDFDEVIRCYNLPVGEFRIAQDNRRIISTMARVQAFTIEQLVQEFGLENCSTRVQAMYKKGGADLYHGVRVAHLIEPNREDGRHIKGGFGFRECWWQLDFNTEKTVLRVAGFTERPFGFPRWETIGNETYGLSPGMDALPDVIQLQHETLRKAEALDKMTDPPLVMDAMMRNQRGSANPGSKFYVPGSSNAGARALYDVRMPLGELSADIMDVQRRIREAFFNDLFRMISMLETVRSATEIDARREEKLVLMGAILERLEDEALDPFMVRVFSIMKRKELLPPPPEGYEELEIEIQYVSILSEAQRAVGTGVIERFVKIIGETGAIRPEVMDIVDWAAIFRDYANRLSVPAVGIRSEEDVAAMQEQKAGMEELAQAAAISKDFAAAAGVAGGIDVGGGQNAFQALSGL